MTGHENPAVSYLLFPFYPDGCIFLYAFKGAFFHRPIMADLHDGLCRPKNLTAFHPYLMQIQGWLPTKKSLPEEVATMITAYSSSYHLEADKQIRHAHPGRNPVSGIFRDIPGGSPLDLSPQRGRGGTTLLRTQFQGSAVHRRRCHC